MPIKSEMMSIQTAKTWAKRLQKTTGIQSPDQRWPLMRCQLAVAQMLGFEHWHALNKALESNPGKVHKTFPEHDANLPASREQWEQFWLNCLNYHGSTGVITQIKGEVAVVELTVHGQTMEYVRGPAEQLIGGLTCVLPGREAKRFSDFIQESLAGYQPINKQSSGGFVGVFDLQGTKIRLNLNCLEGGAWKAVMNLKPLILSTQKTLNVDADVLKKIVSLSSLSSDPGAFMFCGSPGNGKDELMFAVAGKIQKKNPGCGVKVNDDPTEYLIPHVRSIPVIRTETDRQKTMKSGPDLWIAEEIRDSFGSDGVFKAVKSGVWALAGLVCSSDRAIERMSDFDSTKDWGRVIKGWAHTHRLGVLCPECSVVVGEDGEKDKGLGCWKCGGLGLVSHVIVADVYEVVGVGYKQVRRKTDQAVELVRTGRVSRRHAEIAVGPFNN